MSLRYPDSTQRRAVGEAVPLYGPEWRTKARHARCYFRAVIYRQTASRHYRPLFPAEGFPDIRDLARYGFVPSSPWNEGRRASVQR